MSVFHSDLFRQQALIAGSWRDAADGTTLAVSNPSTGATLGQIPNMGRAEAQQAVDAAAAALPNWRAFTAAQRAALLKNWHRLILENKTALAQIMTAEQGKPLAEAEGEKMRRHRRFRLPLPPAACPARRSLSAPARSCFRGSGGASSSITRRAERRLMRASPAARPRY